MMARPKHDYWYRPDEVADALRLTEQYISTLLREGKLRGIKMPTRGGRGRWRVPASAIREYMGLPDTHPLPGRLEEIARLSTAKRSTAKGLTRRERGL